MKRLADRLETPRRHRASREAVLGDGERRHCRPGVPARRTCSSAATQSASRLWPASARSRSSACSWLHASRYTRVEHSASYTSQHARMRVSRSISSPRAVRDTRIRRVARDGRAPSGARRRGSRRARAPAARRARRACGSMSYSSGSSGPGFFRISSGTESFPMSWSRPPIARLAQPPRRQSQLLSHLHRQHRHAAGVTLGVRVLLRQPLHQRMDPRARGTTPRRRPARPPGGRRPADRDCAERHRSSATGAPTSTTPTSSSPCPTHQPISP